MEFDQCITPGCSRRRHSRGLCNPCYGHANRAVAQGGTTWEELETNGLALLSQRPTDGSPMRRAIRKMKEQ